jgi:hypothetical protein
MGERGIASLLYPNVKMLRGPSYVALGPAIVTGHRYNRTAPRRDLAVSYFQIKREVRFTVSQIQI